MSQPFVLSYILLWLLVLVLVFLVIGLLRQVGLIHMRLGPEEGALITNEGLPRGTTAPQFDSFEVRTGSAIGSTHYAGTRVLLLFLAPNCMACRQLAPSLNDISKAEGRRTKAAIICQSSPTDCAQFAALHDFSMPVVADPHNKIGQLFDVHYTPFAYLLSEGWKVLIRGVVNSWPQVEALLEEEGTFQTSEWERSVRSSSDGGGGTDSAGNIHKDH